jgi:hypothetical protein
MELNMVTTKSAIAALLDPSLPNNLKARRRKLGLSRVALARILDVDPATVYRQERADVLAALWHYALRGIEAEAKDTKCDLNSHQARVNQRDLIADMTAAQGHRYTGEKMKRQKPRPKREKAPPVPASAIRPSRPPHGRTLSREEIKAKADAAAARSEMQKT